MNAERSAVSSPETRKSDECSEVLGRIRKAKSSHIRWRGFAQGLVAGVGASEEKVPVRHTDCRFGQWYYSEGRILLGHLRNFRELDDAHVTLHAVYDEIYRLVHEGDIEKARKKLDELIEVSGKLLEKMDALEREVKTSL